MAGTYYELMSPGSRLNFTLDLSTDPWLETGDSLVSASWISRSNYATIPSSSHGSSSATAHIQISSGAPEGTICEVRCLLVTANLLRDYRTLRLVIRNR